MTEISLGRRAFVATAGAVLGSMAVAVLAEPAMADSAEPDVCTE